MRKPNHQGGEFYQQAETPPKNITDIRRQLQKVVHKYNYFRTHNNLAGLTPMQYIQNFYLNNKKKSQYG